MKMKKAKMDFESDHELLELRENQKNRTEPQMHTDSHGFFKKTIKKIF
jgi:hypothetical protein